MRQIIEGKTYNTDTAIHEAGHAVAHVRMNIPSDGASIVPNPERGSLGHSTAAGARHVWNKADAELMVLACCAGYGALVAAGAAPETAEAGGDSDFDEAQELIDFWLLPGDLDEWKARAVELMREPKNVAAVALVAEHLLQRRALDGDFVDVLIEVADGEATDDDLRRYIDRRGLP